MNAEQLIKELTDGYINERGNTWLCSEDCYSHVFYAELDDGKFLHVAISPDNYPGFEVGIIETTQEKAAAHINENLQGWYARKLNIEGVKVDEQNQVIGDDGYTDYATALGGS